MYFCSTYRKPKASILIFSLRSMCPWLLISPASVVRGVHRWQAGASINQSVSFESRAVGCSSFGGQTPCILYWTITASHYSPRLLIKSHDLRLHIIVFWNVFPFCYNQIVSHVVYKHIHGLQKANLFVTAMMIGSFCSRCLSGSRALYAEQNLQMADIMED